MEPLCVPLFRWSGVNVGFLLSGWLFGADGRYLGWYDESGAVWARNGTYLGEIVDEHYVLRRLTVSPPVRQVPKVPPVVPSLPMAPGNRIPRTPRPGWTDGLDRVGLRPERDDLVGLWENASHRLVLRAGLSYVLWGGESPEERGTWSLRGNLILSPHAEQEEETRNRVYAILEYDVETLTLRRVSFSERTLPLTLRRGMPPA